MEKTTDAIEIATILSEAERIRNLTGCQNLTLSNYSEKKDIIFKDKVMKSFKIIRIKKNLKKRKRKEIIERIKRRKVRLWTHTAKLNINSRESIKKV